MVTNKIKIISGGQTGVDRAALDVAKKLALEHGGWCPKGRKAEDGVIPEQYNLHETTSEEYSERTKLNIIDSDGTLVLLPYPSNNAMGGTLMTIQYALEQQRPYLTLNIQLVQNYDANTSVVHWIHANNIKNLNIAGPRESQWPGMYKLAYEYLINLLSMLGIFKMADMNRNE